VIEMDDLRARFRALDDLPVPDLWPTVQRRVAVLEREGSPMPVAVRPLKQTAGARDVRRRPALALAALVVLVAAALIGAALLAGSWFDRNLEISPDPSTAPVSLIGCSEARAAAARTAEGWIAGRPGPTSDARPGWLALWGTEQVPEVVLVHPTTGVRCSLVRFPGHAAPLPVPQPESGSRDWIPFRGPIAWSPDGSALSIVVIDEDGRRQDVYVWSRAGLAGPLLSVDGSASFQPPTWSPDGDHLAVVRNRSNLGPNGPAIVAIAAADGSVRELPVDCANCYGGPIVWSPDGSRSALAAEVNNFAPEPDDHGIAVAGVDDDRLGILPFTRELAVGPLLVGWEDDQHVLLADPGAGQFIGLPVDRPDRPVALRPLRLGESSGIVALSPDRSTWASIQGQGASLLITWIDDGRIRRLARVPEFALVGWAPDGRSVAYLIDEQIDEQGLWTVDLDGEPRRLTDEPLALAKEQFWPPAMAWQPVWTGER
jgi:hypothetical protein